MTTADLLLPALSLYDSLLNPLAFYRSRNCLIVVFAPEKLATELSDQLHQLARCRYELEQRDTVIISALGGERTDLRHYAELMFDARPDRFTLLLIGKDGGVKLHRERPVSGPDILRVLDAMPALRPKAAFA